MSSSAAKEQFLRQMEQIVEGIKQSRIKVQLLQDHSARYNWGFTLFYKLAIISMVTKSWDEHGHIA